MRPTKSPQNLKRTALVPVKPYLYKWLVNRQGYREVMLVNHRFFPYYPHNTYKVYKYFLNEEGYPTIRISAYYPHKRAVYSFVQFLELWFVEELISYVRFATLFELPALRAIKDFLRMCKISEDELALSTAYKRWQRAGMRNLPGVKFA